jgi:hypothetical protein
MSVLPDPGRSRAVLIGASTYRHLEDLPAVRNNLAGFRDVLVAPALGGLPADHCTVVAEPATPVDVYRTLRQHAAAAEDTLLVYFAGHGRTGSRNELWLCLPDTDPDELPYSAWPYDELRRAVADSRATKKVVILDCCFSGRALADQAGDEETILGQVGIEGTYLLTATAANAVALAPPGDRYTAFTVTLLGLLIEGIPDGPELLTFEQIYPRLQHTLTSRQLPRPRQQGSDTIAHLALTRNLAYTGQGEARVFNERFTAIATQLSDAQWERLGTGPDDALQFAANTMIDKETLAAKRRTALGAAFAELPPRCQQLLAILTSDPPSSYAEISARLSIPIGSIGPNRARCVERLRKSMAIAGFGDTDPH